MLVLSAYQFDFPSLFLPIIDKRLGLGSARTKETHTRLAFQAELLFPQYQFVSKLRHKLRQLQHRQWQSGYDHMLALFVEERHIPSSEKIVRTCIR